MSHWLQKLQEADEDHKKIYVIAGTIVASSIVIAIWLTWFNVFNPLAGVPGVADTTANVSDRPATRGFSLWESTKGFFGGLGGVFKAEREVIIKPNQ